MHAHGLSGFFGRCVHGFQGLSSQLGMTHPLHLILASCNGRAAMLQVCPKAICRAT